MSDERTFDAHSRGRGRPPTIPRARIAERAEEISAALFEATHLDPNLDAVAVNEVARLVAYASLVDEDVERRGLVTGSGGLRAIAKLRTELTRAILAWSSALGGNPKARAEIVQALKDVQAPSFAETYERRLAQLRRGSENGSG